MNDIFQNLLEVSLIKLIKNKYEIIKPYPLLQKINKNIIHNGYTFIVCSGNNIELNIDINNFIECNIIFIGSPTDEPSKVNIFSKTKELSNLNIFFLNDENIFNVNLELYNEGSFLLQIFTNGSVENSQININSHIEEGINIKHIFFNLMKKNTHWILEDKIYTDKDNSVINIYNLNIVNQSNLKVLLDGKIKGKNNQINQTLQNIDFGSKPSNINIKPEIDVTGETNIADHSFLFKNILDIDLFFLNLKGFTKEESINLFVKGLVKKQTHINIDEMVNNICCF